MCLVIGDSLTVVDATVEGDVDAEGQESHGGESTPSLADRRAGRVRLQPVGSVPPRSAPRWRRPRPAEDHSSGSGSTVCRRRPRAPRRYTRSPCRSGSSVTTRRWGAGCWPGGRRRASPERSRRGGAGTVPARRAGPALKVHWATVHHNGPGQAGRVTQGPEPCVHLFCIEEHTANAHTVSTGDNVCASRARSQRPSGCLR